MLTSVSCCIETSILFGPSCLKPPLKMINDSQAQLIQVDLVGIDSDGNIDLRP